MVFSKDSIVHIPDKHALARDIFRVLKPGGWFAASDWLIGRDGEPSPEMKAYIAAEGLDFGMASPQRYQAALEAAGFTDIKVTSRNAWYRQQARAEVAAMKGPLKAKAVAELGEDSSSTISRYGNACRWCWIQASIAHRISGRESPPREFR